MTECKRILKTALLAHVTVTRKVYESHMRLGQTIAAASARKDLVLTQKMIDSL